MLGWADDVRRLEVHANADTPADAVKAREFGAQGIGLCRTEHMFFGDERLPVVQEMILADDEAGAARRARSAPALPAERLRGHLRGDGRAAGDHPAARPTAARVPPVARGRHGRAHARAHQGAAPRPTRCSGRAAADSDCSGPRSTRCRCARSCAPPWRSVSAPAWRRIVEIMHPLVAFAEELRRLARADASDRRRRGLRHPFLRRHDDRAPARVPAGGRDRRARRLLLLRHERPDPDGARVLARRCRGQVPHPLPRGRRPRHDPSPRSTWTASAS